MYDPLSANSAERYAALTAHGFSPDQINEIEQAREFSSYQTHRPTSSYLEGIMLRPFLVLNHGFIRVIDYMGDQAAVVQAARVSYGHGAKSFREDSALMRYMLRHAHGTPFEMCEIKFHVKLPIFIARQWIRHRTANVNEYSARYSILDKEFYIPEPEQLAAQSVSNRQGRSEILDAEEAARVLEILRDDSARNYDHYVDMLNEGEGRDPTRKGLARELSRMNLTLNTYTQWYWKCDLRNLLGFLELRADSHAQHEIKVYADIMLHQVVKNWLPDIYQAFMDYNVNSFNFSGPMMDVLRDIVVCKVRLEELPTFVVPSRYPNLNISKRECDEMVAAIRNRTE